MRINFNKVIIHNFLSYGHSELDLSDTGYCLVSGINNCKKDNAVSNGSGKSSWSSAICWAITGETIQGLTSNIKNINIDEDLCFVELDFNVDNNNYIITRYKNPKSDLKIKLNGEDISGKGIRESESILNTYLPDITSQLIASTIILGQGLPFKFTDNSPGGRKDVLEKLSKSDFMIQDLKNRLSERNQKLSTELRTYEDLIVSKTANKDLLLKQKEDQRLKLEELRIPRDFESCIQSTEIELEKVSDLINDHRAKIAELEYKNRQLNDELSKKLSEKSQVVEIETSQFNSFRMEYLERRSALTTKINTLMNKINEIKNIRDVCPTCGQKIPNVTKPSCKQEEEEVFELQEQLEKLTKKYEEANLEHSSYIKQLDEMYSSDLNDINIKIRDVKQKLELYSSDLKIKESKNLQLQSDINKFKLEKENFDLNIKNAENALYNLDLTINKLEEELLYNINEKDRMLAHIHIINQMNTLIKRDFRGFLLGNIINYIDNKAKEYANDIFGNTELEFVLSGNNIDISYCGKAFENLSGGEKQKVDLIIQLSIRDMMKKYLNFTSNVLILDEIFDQLDMLGCTNVLNLIANKFNDIESMFIISHRAGELEIPYDSEIVVIKDEEGVSRLICQ